MAAGDGFELFNQRMEAKQGTEAALDGGIWDILSQLLPILIPLIAGCFGGASKVNRKPIRLGNRARVAVGLQRKTGCSWADAFKVSDHAFDVLGEANMDEFRSFVHDCCSAQ